MVEFGLKLEDNKVDEWSDKYIDYEKLKTVLKRAKSGAEYRDDLKKRASNAVVAEVTELRRSRYGEREAKEEAIEIVAKAKAAATDALGGGAGAAGAASSASVASAPPSTTVTSTPSALSVATAAEGAASAPAHDGRHISHPLEVPVPSAHSQPTIHHSNTTGATGTMATDTTPLLISRQSSNQSLQSIKSNMSGTSNTPTAASVSSGRLKRGNSWTLRVTSYLGLADDRSLLLHAYDDADEKLDLFKKAYEKELKKVNDFYRDQLSDTSQRMEALIESVDTSRASFLKKKRHRQTQSLMESVKSVYKNMLNTNNSNIPGRRDSLLGSLFQNREEDLTLSHLKEDSSGDIMEDLEELYEGGGEQQNDLEYNSKKGLYRRTSSDKKKGLDLVREADSIKRAIADIYRTAKLLHNFSIMNYTGFVKIAKKFDKTFPEHNGMFKGQICDDGKKAEQLAARVEGMYARWFCDGDIREAQAQLLSKRGDGLMMDWTQLRLGYRLGMCSILALWVAWDCVWGQFAKGEVSIGGRSAFPVFRGCFGLLSWHWFWGMAVYVWTRYRINYIYLFDFDPRIVDTPIDIFNDAVDETLVFLICMLMYYKAGANDMPQIVPPGAYPMILVIYTAKCLIFPWKIRKPLWVAIQQVLSAPLVSPTFFLTYVGDVFTSMVKVFQDLLWTVCFVVSGDWILSETKQEKHHAVHLWAQSFWYKNVAIPLICMFPLWLRFNQCLRRYLDTGKRFPNLANAFKYAMSQSVTLFGAFHPLYLIYSEEEEKNISLIDDDVEEVDLVIGSTRRSNLFQYFWMGLFIASSLYSFCWDVYMDWGLGRREYGFLGPRLMFPRRLYYYLVMVVDLILRFMWVLTLIPPQSGAKFELPAYLSSISMTLELFRRTIWSFFRLEHEHRQNTEGYRRVGVVPLHFNTGHKHKYNERHWVGWRVLVEIAVVTFIVVAISAFSVIAAQRATHKEQFTFPFKQTSVDL